MIPLKVDQLTKTFTSSSWWGGAKETFTAVNNISFELKPGEILGLLGPNGAGKTTTIHMLLGVTDYTSGTIAYFGEDFKKHRSEIMKKVSFASAYSRLMGRLTVYENMVFHAQMYDVVGADQHTRIMDMLQLFGIDHLKDRKAAALSAGENTRSLLAKAFLPRPWVILLDEPTAALDPDIAYSVRNFILQQRKQHEVSILFTSHNMDEVTEVCDRVLMLKDGTIIGRDTPQSLAATVSQARVELVSTQADAIAQYAQEQGLKVTRHEHSLQVKMNEQQVPQFLAELTKRYLGYDQIAIDRPRLADYFREIAKRRGSS